METNLHPQHLAKARIAILRRFAALNVAPGQIANVHAFSEEQVEYSGGYFNAALQALVDEGHVHLGDGRFLRLTESGYEEAQAA